MTVPTRLTDDECRERLATLTGWKLENGKLFRELEFKDFVDAFGFMARIAIVAERVNHHPEWFNVYNRVRISLATHEVNGISELDFELASAINNRFS